MWKTPRTSVALILTALLLVTACSSNRPSEGPDQADALSHEDLVAAAEQEGTFTWYTSMTAEVADALVAAFAKDYPKVKTEIVKSNTAGLLQTFLADHSRRRVVADVVTLADFSSVDAAKQVGALQDYVPEDVMSLVRADSRVMEPTALTMYVAAFPWVYRVDAPGEVVEAFKRGDWEMFSDPRIKELLKGRVVSTDPSAGGAPLSSYESLKYGLGDAKFESFLKNFGEIQPVFFNSNVPTIEAVSSGERLAGMVADVVALPEAVKNPMLRVQYFSPTPGYVRTVSLAAGAPHPNAGRLFMKWLLSANGQASLQELYGVEPLVNGVTDTRAITKLPWYTKDALDGARITVPPLSFISVIDEKEFVKDVNRMLGRS